MSRGGGGHAHLRRGGAGWSLEIRKQGVNRTVDSIPARERVDQSRQYPAHAHGFVEADIRPEMFVVANDNMIGVKRDRELALRHDDRRPRLQCVAHSQLEDGVQICGR